MTREDALKDIRHGAIAACVSGAITLLAFLAATAMKASSENGSSIWGDPSIIIDVILVFTLAWFIHKRSRTAAILMFVYFVFAKIYIGLETKSFTSIPFALIFFYFYGRAVWGSFAFHKIEKATNPDYKTPKKWIMIVSGIVIVLVLSLVTIGIMTMSGGMPSTKVQAGSDVHQSHIDKLTEAGIISSREDIEYFYSPAFASVLEEGVFLAPESVTLYLKAEDGEIMLYELPYTDIKKIEKVDEGDFMTPRTYLLSTDDPDTWLQFGLSIEADGHLQFIKALRAKAVNASNND